MVLRVVGEIVVMVPGVFIALVADSWRENRVDREREESGGRS